MWDAFPQNLVGRQPDRVRETLGFEVIVSLRRGEGGVTSEIEPYLPTLVANDNRLQHAFPIIGTEIEMLAIGNCVPRKNEQDSQSRIDYKAEFELD
jgi:hypothetical protein|tara:strand:+ start:430 stop:717 length:288 start_codon:yes stop_codon:yes gene_type:complete